MSANNLANLAGNRNSTPEATNTLRPPSSRQGLRTDHSMRASADMGAFSASALPSRSIRPASEVYFNQANAQQGQTADDLDKATQQWLTDIDQYEATLEEMATATLDQDFKDELSAIEQWFKVLSEAEPTAALYALLQQTTQVQIRFFIQVLQEMAQNHPMSGILSPASFGQKDPMSQKLTDAMNKLTVEGSRHSLGIIGRPPPSPGAKRLSGLDPSIINSMFPDAAAAIAKQKEQFTATTGMAPSTRNSIIGDRNSLVMTNRDSLIAPTISAPPEEIKKDSISGWGQRAQDAQRPKSSSSQTPMGQFTQPPPSAGLRSPRHLSGDTNLQHTTLNAADPSGLSLLSPYPGGSWASMMNTPMTATFNTQQQGSHNQADIANATAMKLAALSTVNNRIQFDDVRKYRRTRSTDQTGGPASPLPLNFTLNATNEHGHMLTPQQIAALQAQQAQQIAAIQARNRSRPNSPGLFVSGAPPLGTMPLLHTPQNAQFLTAFDSSPFNATAMLGGGMAHGSALAEGYASDHAEMHVRGRSPRGRRGSSKPPEDPTDMTLLQDIPAWLRSLRLHKYTDQLKELKWQELVELDDEGLENRGVAAKGARTKMLKVFEQVKEAKTEGRLS